MRAARPHGMQAPALLDLLLLVAEQALDEVFHVPLVLDGDEHSPQLVELFPPQLEGLVPHVLGPIAARADGLDVLARQFIAAFHRLYFLGEDSATWSTEAMAYGFSLGAGTAGLATTHYPGGATLPWYGVDRAAAAPEQQDTRRCVRRCCCCCCEAPEPSDRRWPALCCELEGSSCGAIKGPSSGWNDLPRRDGSRW